MTGRAALLAALLAAAAVAAPEDAPAGEDDRLSWSLRWIAGGTWRDPADTALGRVPGLAGPEREGKAELRLDLEAGRGGLSLRAKPRLLLRTWEGGVQDAGGDDAGGEADLRLNEGGARWDAPGGVTLEAGRFVVDWGPSRIFPASNPFGGRNARIDPKEEQPGSDFLAARWVPDGSWSLALLANVAAGRRPAEGFRRTAVLKVDRSLPGTYLGAVLAAPEGAPARAGLFATRELAGALLATLEGSAARGDAEAVAGLSWTFASGAVLTAEYFHNGGGSADADPVALAADFAASDGRDLFWRRNYALLQWLDAGPGAPREWILRWVHCLDDGSAALVARVEQGAGDHARLFLFGVRTVGRGDGELSAVLRALVSAGVEYAF